MNEARSSVRLAGKDLRRTGHACAFFNSREEEYRVLLPFAREGLERGELFFNVVDARHRSERLRRLEEVSDSVALPRRPGQIEVRGWEEGHLRGGCFHQEEMLALVEEVLIGAKADGFGLARLWGSMEWALEECPGVQDLLEYEARLNHIMADYDDVVVCTYDLTRFGPGVVVDALRTHPMVIIGGILQENPFFVQPYDFLRELRERDVPALTSLPATPGLLAGVRPPG